jgi:hypothetical protein
MFVFVPLLPNLFLTKWEKDPGMTWDNQGTADDEWQIDHIIPFVAFDTSNRDEQFIVCWYQNTQPLWGPANRSKSGKYTE